MTVTIDKKSIHFGWEVFAGIMVFTISMTWAAAMYNSNSDKKQDDMLQSLTQIQKTLARQQVKDSVQDVRIDTLYARQTQEQYRFNGFLRDINEVRESIRTVRTIQYFTEKKMRGRIQLSEVKP